jgi:hypothetical protein
MIMMMMIRIGHFRFFLSVSVYVESWLVTEGFGAGARECHDIRKPKTRVVPQSMRKLSAKKRKKI